MPDSSPMMDDLAAYLQRDSPLDYVDLTLTQASKSENVK